MEGSEREWGHVREHEDLVNTRCRFRRSKSGSAKGRIDHGVEMRIICVLRRAQRPERSENGGHPACSGSMVGISAAIGRSEMLRKIVTIGHKILLTGVNRSADNLGDLNITLRTA